MWNHFPLGSLFPLLSLVHNGHVFRGCAGSVGSVSVQGAEAGTAWETEPGFPT